MSSEGGVIIGGCCVAIVVAFLFAFVPVLDGVYPEDYEKATVLCEPNGGVDYVYRNDYATRGAAADCKNGVTVKWPGFELPLRR